MNYEENYTDNYSFARVHMTPDEHILWKGKPSLRPLLARQDYFTIIFGAVWCFLPGRLMLENMKSGEIADWLFPALFFAVGFCLMIGRPFFNAFMRTRTQYVITNKKIIRKRGSHIDFLSASTMPPSYCTVHSDGSGTITFGYQTQTYNKSKSVVVFSLENVQNVAQVQSAIDRMER